jgi:hypothetical protein
LVGEPFHGGWLHRLEGYVPPPTPKRPTLPPIATEDFAPLAEKCRCALLDVPNGIEALSQELGLSVEYLGAACTGWLADYHGSWFYRGYTFPMKDGRGKIIGIQVRTKQGKLSVPGSHGGMFWPKGVSVKGEGPLLLPEGATSCGACFDLGYDTVGRFNCSARIDLIQDLVAQCPPQRLVVIVADHDEKHYKLDGSVYFPGQEGAARIAKAIKPIHRLLKVIKPPRVKDMRNWLHQGATHDVVELVIKDTRFV